MKSDAYNELLERNNELEIENSDLKLENKHLQDTIDDLLREE